MGRIWEIKHLITITALFFLLSCSREKQDEVIKQPSANEAQASYSIEISPAEASKNGTLSLIVNGFDINKAQIEWLVNGMPSAIHASYFNLEQVKKGDTVQARAIVQGKEIRSNIITIKNAPPEIRSIKFMPDVLKPGETLYVEVAGEDVDGDDVRIFYEWTKNGEPAGTEKSIGLPIKRGDKLSVKITPFDGEDYGRTAVLDREIANFPPVIVEEKNFSFDGIRFTYQVKATDPDDDKLIYSLKLAPSGMTIEKTTGLIQWIVPQEFKGKAEVAFVVSDGKGGEALQSFTFEIAPEK